MDLNLSDHEKRILSNIGSGGYGKELVQIMHKVRTKLCSLEDLPEGEDHNVQVEARILFKKFANALIERLETDPRRGKLPPEMARGSDDYS